MNKLDPQVLKNPVQFCQQLLVYQGKPLRLYPFQKEILEKYNFFYDRFCLLKGRAIGGSFLMAAAITYYASCYSDARIAIISKTMVQSGWIFDHVRRFFETSDILNEWVDKKRSKKETLWLKNGTSVQHFTAGHNAENLRGFHCEGKGFLCFDESASISEIAVQNCLPSAINAGIVHCSTPRGTRGSFYAACNSPDFETLVVPSHMSPRITKRDLDMWKRNYSPSRYLNEVLAQFATGAGEVFSENSVNAAVDKKLPLFHKGTRMTSGDKNKNYIWSLDIAKHGKSKEGDWWVLTVGEIVEGNKLKVVCYHNWMGECKKNEDDNADLAINPQVIIDDLRWYYKEFHPIKFYVDASSNSFFPHVLEYQERLPVVPIVWSQVVKTRIMENLASHLRAGRVAIPNDPDLISQLLDYAYDERDQPDGGKLRVYLSQRDDMVASLAMLTECLSLEDTSDFCEFIGSI